MRIDGLKSKYYDLLLTPEQDPFFTSTAILFFRRIIHLLKHQEWITDAKLVSKFKSHLNSHPEMTLKLKMIAHVFRVRLNNPSLFQEISLPCSTSPFSKELWFLARTGDPEAPINDTDFNTDGLSPHHKALIEQAKVNFRTSDFSKARDHLLQALEKIEFEMGITKQIQDLLKNMILEIQSGNSSHKLMLNLRIVREYINHRYSQEATGESGKGLVTPTAAILHRLLFPNSYLSPTRDWEKIKVQGNILYYPSTREELLDDDSILSHETAAWAAGLFLTEGSHSVSYVYTAKGFIRFDNLQKTLSYLSASEMHNHLRDFQKPINTIDFTRVQAMILPLGHGVPPQADKWSWPKWERSNCFLATALMYLALTDHYQKLS